MNWNGKLEKEKEKILINILNLTKFDQDFWKNSLLLKH